MAPLWLRSLGRIDTATDIGIKDRAQHIERHDVASQRSHMGEAGSEIANVEINTTVGVVDVCYSKTIVDMVFCRGDGARILPGLAGMVVCCQTVDAVVPMTMECIGSSEVVCPTVAVIATVTWVGFSE